MYDDLARSQQRGVLEWLVVNALIPSVLLTVVLQWPQMSGCALPPQVSSSSGIVFPPEEPDAFPALIRMRDPVYLQLLRRNGIQDRVVLRALVDSAGHVDAATIVAVQAIHPAFITSAREALSQALFRPARFGGRPGAAWITLAIDFTLPREIR